MPKSNKQDNEKRQKPMKPKETIHPGLANERKRRAAETKLGRKGKERSTLTWF